MQKNATFVQLGQLRRRASFIYRDPLKTIAGTNDHDPHIRDPGQRNCRRHLRQHKREHQKQDQEWSGQTAKHGGWVAEDVRH